MMMVKLLWSVWEVVVVVRHCVTPRKARREGEGDSMQYCERGRGTETEGGCPLHTHTHTRTPTDACAQEVRRER